MRKLFILLITLCLMGCSTTQTFDHTFSKTTQTISLFQNLDYRVSFDYPKKSPNGKQMLESSMPVMDSGEFKVVVRELSEYKTKVTISHPNKEREKKFMSILKSVLEE